MAKPGQAPKKRAGASNYRANLMYEAEEAFLCFDDHYEDLFNRIVDLLVDLGPVRRAKVRSVKIYRWNGVADAGVWAISTVKPMSSFKKRIEEIEASLSSA